MLEAALQALDLTNLDLNLPAQLLVLGGQVLEVRCPLVRILQGTRKNAFIISHANLKRASAFERYEP